MKQIKLFKGLLVAILLLCSLFASAYDFSAKNDDGVTIYYDIVSSSDHTCEVVYKDRYTRVYSGDIVIPETVKRSGTTYTVVGIGEDAFFLSYSLTSVVIPNSVTTIGGYAFGDCYKLTSIKLGTSVESIGEWAFRDCTSLTSVDIPDSVTSIGAGAFEWCSGLTSVTIPDSVTTIGGQAFRDCTGLTSVTLGNSVTSIGYWAFQYCSSLTSVTIGTGVTEIGERAFYDCSKLESIYSLNPEPPECGSRVFDGVDKEACTLYVPIGSYNAYATADQWEEFNIVEMDMTGIESVASDGAEVVGYYTIDGKAVNVPQRGVNIVKYSDGSTRKILVQ